MPSIFGWVLFPLAFILHFGPSFGRLLLVLRGGYSGDWSLSKLKSTVGKTKITVHDFICGLRCRHAFRSWRESVCSSQVSLVKEPADFSTFFLFFTDEAGR